MVLMFGRKHCSFATRSRCVPQKAGQGDTPRFGGVNDLPAVG